jgi:two-component system chemotaxis response regulator CheB
LPVAAAGDGEAIVPGRVYVAPPDRHVLLTATTVRLSHGPRENRHRPAIDPLFRSAAIAFGPRVIGLIVSGMLDDGTAGLRAVKACGGIAMAQDPAEAAFPSMPVSALRNVTIDHCAPVAQLAELLTRLAREPAADRARYPVPESLALEVRFAFLESDMKDINDMSTLGTPSNYACPHCHGPLTEVLDGDMLRFRCHTGHAFAAESLLAQQDRDTEDALYAAVRAVEENAALARRLAERWGDRFPRERQASETKARELERTAQVLRRLLVNRNGSAGRAAAQGTG